MTLLKIARMGHPVLISRAEEILDPTTREIRTLVENMVETMVDAQGVGLAAPQVHVGKRVIIFNSPKGRSDEDAPETDFAPVTALINPEIQILDETQEFIDKAKELVPAATRRGLQEAWRIGKSPCSV